MDNLRSILKAAYRRVNSLSGGIPELLRNAFESFNQARAGEAAASLAYYTIFSLFPLALGLVVAGSFFLERERVYQEVVSIVTEAIPISQNLIESNIQPVFEQRGAVSVIGLIGLMWAGTGVFTVLARHINQAWPEAKPRTFLERRAVALAMVGALAAILLLSLLSTPLLSLLPRIRIPVLGGLLWTLASSFVSWLLTLLLFLGLYRWVPNTEVAWWEAFWGALPVAFTWELAKQGFAWYLSSGLIEYRLIYGSLGAVVVLMIWIYLSSWLALFGAHLSAAIARPET